MWWRKKKPQQPTKVKLLIKEEMREQLQAQASMLYQAHLIRAAAEVNGQALSNGLSPEESVNRFYQTYELMQDWFRAKPVKEEIKAMLDTFLPETYY